MKSINKKWLVLISTGIMIMLVNVDMTVISLALAKIAVFFQANMNQVQWIIGSYFLATALSFIIFGRLADQWGRKKIFLIGTLLFTFSSLLAGITDHLAILIFARFIQGLGFAATLGLSIILIVNAFPENHKGFATGMAVTISGLSQAIGPTLGGAILQYFGWRWIFLLNVPLGILSFIMTILFVKHDILNNKNLPFNVYNALIFVIGLGFILFSLNQIDILSWKLLFVYLIFGFSLFVLFIVNSLRNSKPLIDVDMLHNRPYLYIIFLRLCFMIMMCSLLFIIPFYLQNILNFSAGITGIAMLGMTFFVAFSSAITGKLLDRIGYTYPILFSFIFAIGATLIISNFNTYFSLPNLLLGFFLFGLAVGVHTPSSINGALAQIVKEKSGAAIGIFFTYAMIGATIGIAFSGMMMSVLSKFFLNNIIRTQNFVIKDDVFNKLSYAANGTYSINNVGLSSIEIANYTHSVQKAFINSFHVELLVLTGLMTFSFILCLRLNKIIKMNHNKLFTIDKLN